MNKNPEYLKIAEAAEFLGVTKRTVYRRIWSGDLPAKKVGGLYFISKSDIEALLRTGKGGESVSEEKQEQTSVSTAMKCGACLRLIRSYDQIAARCTHEGCDAIICEDCANKGIQTCRKHSISLSEKFQDAQKAFEAGEISLVLKGNEARLREMNFLNRIQTRLSLIETLAHPITGEPLLISDWDAILEKHDERAEIMRLSGKVMLDTTTLAKTPLNSSLLYSIPSKKRQVGLPVEIQVKVLSHLPSMIENGFDTEPFTKQELTEQLVQISDELNHEKKLRFVIIAATSGWDKSVSDIILGKKVDGQRISFVHPSLFLYLFDMKKWSLIYNTNDDRLKQYAELFTPVLPAEEVAGAVNDIEKLLNERGHESLTLLSAESALGYSTEIIKKAFKKLESTGAYSIVTLPDLGEAIIQK